MGNQIWRAASTIGVAWSNWTEPRFEDTWAYKDVFRMGETHPHWFIPRDELAELPQIDDHPAVAHIPVRWRHYFQDRSLWWPARRIVREMLSPSAYARSILDPIAADLFTPGVDHIAVHVRRGDNVTNEAGSINLLPIGYYLEAWDHLADREPGMRSWSTVVFTDDPDWCESELPDEWRVYRGAQRAKELTPEYLTETPTDWIDLALFARPEIGARVLSNSSYAYWGAVLNGSPRVAFPSYWVGEQLTSTGMDPGRLFGMHGWQCVSVDDPNPLPPAVVSSPT